MSVCSLGFLSFCIAVVIVFHLTPGKRLRQIILAAVNALFLIPLVPNRRSWACFAVTFAGAYLALVLVRAWRRGMVAAVAIALILAVYLYLKRYSFVADWIPIPLEWDLHTHPVELVGLSYMLFKLIHMIVDQWQGQLAPFDLWSFLNYQLSFFTLTAGPIQRYNDFQRSWEEMDLVPSETRESLLLWSRILTGMIKIAVLGAFAHAAFIRASATLQPDVLADALICFYVYPVYLYFNFSGYTDVMIGAGGLLGFKLPENFNRPYLARNVLDFWDRWHISLTHWIRDYVFMASYKVAATKFPSAARYWSYALLFLALFVAGVWHGTSEGFVVFGALNGLGAALTRVFGDGLRATLGRTGLQAYLRNRFIRWIAVLVTLHYVCFCLLFFSASLDGALALLGAASGAISNSPTLITDYVWRTRDIALFVSAALALAALWKADAIGVVIARCTSAITRRPALLYTVMYVQTAIVVFVFFVDWAFQKEPPPVLYMTF